MTEQIMVKRAKRRIRYAKVHPIQKRTRKDSVVSSQSKNGTPLMQHHIRPSCVVQLNNHYTSFLFLLYDPLIVILKQVYILFFLA
jgi:hypothetical protein